MKGSCKTNYEYKTHIDSRRADISGERNVHKELVTMPLEGFGCENNEYTSRYDNAKWLLIVFVMKKQKHSTAC